MERVVVLADDRTGALETAGALARADLPVPVSPFASTPPDSESAPRSVVDMATRHLVPRRAAERAAIVAAGDTATHAVLLLKMDSTLRGNWAAEAVAVASMRGVPTVVVASFPAAGRICVAGQVLEDGRPVASGPAGADPRRSVNSSRVADLLAVAGVSTPTHCADARALESWLGDAPSGFAVCDAVTDDDLADLGRVWARSGRALFVGTAASIAASVQALEGGPAAAPVRPVLALPALVCVGSLHPAARAQVDVLAEAGWTVEVVGSTAPAAVSDRHLVVTAPSAGAPGSGAASVALADLVGRRRSERTWNTLVVIGGDTAEAVLGSSTVSVGGLLGPGIPWGHLAEGGPLVVTKPGGFGGPDAIARLFDETA